MMEMTTLWLNQPNGADTRKTKRFTFSGNNCKGQPIIQQSSPLMTIPGKRHFFNMTKGSAKTIHPKKGFKFCIHFTLAHILLHFTWWYGFTLFRVCWWQDILQNGIVLNFWPKKHKLSPTFKFDKILVSAKQLPIFRRISAHFKPNFITILTISQTRVGHQNLTKLLPCTHFFFKDFFFIF